MVLRAASVQARFRGTKIHEHGQSDESEVRIDPFQAGEFEESLLGLSSNAKGRCSLSELVNTRLYCL